MASFSGSKGSIDEDTRSTMQKLLDAFLGIKKKQYEGLKEFGESWTDKPFTKPDPVNDAKIKTAAQQANEQYQKLTGGNTQVASSSSGLVAVAGVLLLIALVR